MTFTTKWTHLFHGRQEARTHNMCFDIEWQCHIAGAESQIGSSVQRMKFSAKIPLHLKAQTR
jgi:hypothetical protein